MFNFFNKKSPDHEEGETFDQLWLRAGIEEMVKRNEPPNRTRRGGLDKTFSSAMLTQQLTGS